MKLSAVTEHNTDPNMIINNNIHPARAPSPLVNVLGEEAAEKPPSPNRKRYQSSS
jgi:hypothetical protein